MHNAKLKCGFATDIIVGTGIPDGPTERQNDGNTKGYRQN